MIKRIVPVILLALVLSGCASERFQSVERAWSALTSTTVSRKTVDIAASTFDAVEKVGTRYLRLPRCTGVNGPVCRNPTATAVLIPAIRSGKSARTALVRFVRQHPGDLGANGLYDALLSATDTLDKIYLQYGIK